MRFRGGFATLGLLVLGLAEPTFRAWRAALVTPTFHMDGAFQTASGLLRLSEGALPGRDFLPYLGIGPILAMYPVFLAAGSNLAASVFAENFVTRLILEVTVAVTAALATSWCGRRMVIVAALTCVLADSLYWLATAGPRLALPEDVGNWLGVDALAVMAQPGNSLRPTRAFAPFLLALAAWPLLARPYRSRRWPLLLGTSCGIVGVLWSNDYAITSAGLCLGLACAHFARKRASVASRSLDLALLLASAGAAAVLAGMVATGGHLADYLAYNWSDVRSDQYWYFGPWGPGSRVNSPGDLLAAVFSGLAPLAVVVLAWVCLRAVRSRSPHQMLQAYLGVSLLAGGLVATVGGHVGAYFDPFRSWALIWVAARAIVWVSSQEPRVPVWRSRVAVGWPIRSGATEALALTITVLGSFLSLYVATSKQATLAASPDFVFEPRLGGYLDREFEGLVEDATREKWALIEEYTGLSTAATHVQSSVPVDSVIAALGSQRAAYERYAAEKADHVITSAPGISEFIGWTVSANWWLYRVLFTQYSPARTSPNTILWSRSPEGVAWPPVGCRTDDIARTITIESDRVGLYEVELRYQGPGRGSRRFSMAQNNVNWAAGADGWLALDPGAVHQAFPVYVAASDPSVLQVVDAGAAGEGVATRLMGCAAHRVLASPSDIGAGIYLPWLEEEYRSHRATATTARGYQFQAATR